MLVNRRSFLKGLGGMAALIVAPTVGKTPLVKGQGELLYPLVFIGDKRLPAHQMTCTLTYRDKKNKQTTDSVVAEFAITGILYDSSWYPDWPLQTPVTVRVLMDGVTYIGDGMLTRFGSEQTSVYTYHLTIVMWYVCIYK